VNVLTLVSFQELPGQVGVNLSLFVFIGKVAKLALEILRIGK